MKPRPSPNAPAKKNGAARRGTAESAKQREAAERERLPSRGRSGGGTGARRRARTAGRGTAAAALPKRPPSTNDSCARRKRRPPANAAPPGRRSRRSPRRRPCTRPRTLRTLGRARRPLAVGGAPIAQSISAAAPVAPSAPAPRANRPRKAKPAAEQVAEDPFSDFRASVVGASAGSVFRLMPIDGFARSSRPAAAVKSDDRQTMPSD